MHYNKRRRQKGACMKLARDRLGSKEKAEQGKLWDWVTTKMKRPILFSCLVGTGRFTINAYSTWRRHLGNKITVRGSRPPALWETGPWGVCRKGFMLTFQRCVILDEKRQQTGLAKVKAGLCQGRHPCGTLDMTARRDEFSFRTFSFQTIRLVASGLRVCKAFVPAFLSLSSFVASPWFTHRGPSVWFLFYEGGTWASVTHGEAGKWYDYLFIRALCLGCVYSIECLCLGVCVCECSHRTLPPMEIGQ